MLGQALEVEGRLRQDRVDVLLLGDLQHRVRERRVRARRDDVERIAEMAADRAFAHVGADEPHLALAVLGAARAAAPPCRARRTR